MTGSVGKADGETSPDCALLRRSMPAVVPRPPGTIPVISAILSYLLGFASVLAMIFVFGNTTDGWMGAGAWAFFVTSILDVIAFVGGIWGIVRAQRLPERVGLARSIVATVMGLLGFIGVFLILLLMAAAVPFH